jgi:hypothetical protein
VPRGPDGYLRTGPLLTQLRKVPIAPDIRCRVDATLDAVIARKEDGPGPTAEQKLAGVWFR